MAVKLKLTRLGSKKHPFYRVVAANDETRRDGRPLEFLGYYNPMTDPAEVKLDAEKAGSRCRTHRHRPRSAQEDGLRVSLQDTIVPVFPVLARCSSGVRY